MHAIRLLPLLFSGWLVLPAHADQAQDLLKRLAQAEQQQSYQGTFVYERNGSFSTHRIWRRVVDGKSREHVLQLDGSAQEILRVDGAVQCVSGQLANGVSNLPDAPGHVLDAKKLANWYDLKVAGASRVAARAATIVTLTPKDQHRYGMELHIDNETGLPLKSLLLSDNGQLLERFQFTGVNTLDIPTDAMLQPTADCKPVELAKARADAGKASDWRSDWLPPGFELTSSAARVDSSSKSLVTSLMYDDGLARFSVFIEPVNGSTAKDIRTQLGPTVAVSRRLSMAKGDVMVTVVGEIPLGTAERIALSIRGNGAAASQ